MATSEDINLAIDRAHPHATELRTPSRATPDKRAVRRQIRQPRIDCPPRRLLSPGISAVRHPVEPPALTRAEYAALPMRGAMHKKSYPVVSLDVLQEAAVTGRALEVIVRDGSRRPPVAEHVTIVSVSGATVVVRNARGQLNEVPAGLVGDPVEARRILAMDNWFTRFLDKLSWIFWL